MEISASASHSQLSTQQNNDKIRDESKAQLQTTQSSESIGTNDNPATVESVEELSASEQSENRNNEQVTRTTDSAPSPDETIGGQLDIRA